MQELLKITDEQAAFLDTLGLSSDEVSLFDFIAHSDTPVSAQDAAEHLRTFPSATYRLFYDLEELALISRVGGRPRTYNVVNVDAAIVAAVQARKILLEQSLQSIDIGTELSSVDAQVIVGRQQTYDAYIKDADKTCKSIRIFAIGIAMNDALLQCHQSALKRGVKIYHVVQKFKPSNYHVINKWHSMGVNMRHFDGVSGFHIVVYDEEKVMVTFSDVDDTDNRLSIITSNSAAVELFNTKFQEIWACSNQIKLA